MKTKFFSNLYRSLGLSLGALLAMAGAVHAPTARATISCPAAIDWYAHYNTWSAPRAFYEVGVGGVLTSTTFSIRGEGTKIGAGAETIMLDMTPSLQGGAQIIRGNVNGISMPGNPGLALRTHILRDNGTSYVFTGTTTETLQQITQTQAGDFQISTGFRLEIVRAQQEDLPPGTRWNVTGATRLSRSMMLSMRSSASTTVPTNCGPLEYTSLGQTNYTGNGGGGGGIPNVPQQPVTCTLGFDNATVAFGSINIDDLRTTAVGQPPPGFAKRAVNVNYACQNASANASYLIGWHGTAANGVTTALRVTDPNSNQVKSGLGIALETSATTPRLVPINTTGNSRVAAPNPGAAGGRRITLYAYPIRTDNSQITLGPFRATATVRIDFY